MTPALCRGRFIAPTADSSALISINLCCLSISSCYLCHPERSEGSVGCRRLSLVLHPLIVILSAAKDLA